MCKAEFRAIFSGVGFKTKEDIKVPEVPEWLRQIEREASEEHIEALWPRIWVQVENFQVFSKFLKGVTVSVFRGLNGLNRC